MISNHSFEVNNYAFGEKALIRTLLPIFDHVKAYFHVVYKVRKLWGCFTQFPKQHARKRPHMSPYTPAHACKRPHMHVHARTRPHMPAHARTCPHTPFFTTWKHTFMWSSSLFHHTFLISSCNLSCRMKIIIWPHENKNGVVNLLYQKSLKPNLKSNNFVSKSCITILMDYVVNLLQQTCLKHVQKSLSSSIRLFKLRTKIHVSHRLA